MLEVLPFNIFHLSARLFVIHQKETLIAFLFWAKAPKLKEAKSIPFSSKTAKMKKLILSLFLFGLFTTTYAQDDKKESKWIPTVGINASAFENESNDLRTEAKPGFELGIDYRTKGRFYFQPGVRYFSFGNEVVNLEDADETVFFGEQASINGYKVPLNVGLNLINKNWLKLRVFGGTTLTRITKIDESVAWDTDDFNKNIWGANVGVGADLWFGSVDLTYQNGRKAMISGDNSTKNDVLSLTVGVKF